MKPDICRDEKRGKLRFNKVKKAWYDLSIDYLPFCCFANITVSYFWTDTEIEHTDTLRIHWSVKHTELNFSNHCLLLTVHDPSFPSHLLTWLWWCLYLIQPVLFQMSFLLVWLYSISAALILREAEVFPCDFRVRLLFDFLWLLLRLFPCTWTFFQCVSVQFLCK